MAQGEFIASEPSAVTVNSVAIYGCTEFSINASAQNAKMLHDDKAYALDGGNESCEESASATFIQPRDQAGTPVTLETTLRPGTDPGTITATFQGKGALAVAKTVTIANPRVASNNATTQGRRGGRQISFDVFSSDGSTPGISIAYA